MCDEIKCENEREIRPCEWRITDLLRTSFLAVDITERK
jgi:hypothetical protein